MSNKLKGSYMTNRNTYKQVKRYDHAQFDEFCKRVYMDGYNAGRESVPGIDMESVLKQIGRVRGVGPALLDRITAAVNGSFAEKEG